VHASEGRRAWDPEQERVALDLAAGEHELAARIGQASGDWSFSLALARTGGSVLFRDSGLGRDDQRIASYRAYAFENTGDLANGYRLFMDTRRLGCVRCHVLTTTSGRTGDAVGPDLDGIGDRSSRRQLITSILEPSERIASGYAAVRVWTTDGRQLTGQVLKESAHELVLVDSSGEPLVLRKGEIAGRTTLAASVMPEGFDALLAPQELADLVTFLASLKGGDPFTAGLTETERRRGDQDD
jgi:putative heme-binding domain-containing protein